MHNNHNKQKMHIDQEINAQNLRSQKEYNTVATGFRWAIEGDFLCMQISLVSKWFSLFLPDFCLNVGVCHPGRMFTNKADAPEVNEYSIMGNIKRIRTL